MKKILITLVAVVTGYCTYAQTNTFPSSGSVGIGTTTPSSLLHLQSTNVPLLSLVGTGVITWKLGNFDQSTDNGFTIGFNATKTFYINTLGYLGIGTTAPVNLFTVVGTNGGSNPGNTATFSSNYGSTSSVGNQLNVTNLQTTWGLLAGFDGPGVPAAFYHGPNTAYLINVQNAPLYFGTNNSQNMMITAGGNVCIGTTNPQGYLLAVNGSAIATSVTVKLNANWPDYVFKTDYRLPLLQEVKTYIDQNHHLPEMPSAGEVEKDGLNLGEANKLLTKKVEELTLYLIDEDKVQKELKDTNKQQADQLKLQQEQINKLSQEVESLIRISGKN